ncbi:hypothetical protein G7066_15055 [Leucobacter coleopterorum]|uniref:DUF3558 domain-containing protein n=1 Tax=Leucobacter coleopterorum TaxID=2714933 RepID=A0ABX6K2Y2_9MICO|nr:hypothetical protein [Leucobacter coleopterorum]QIM19564.1 hypothetical protein G7066_15055 [Leucobacter coleopterorum]
MTRRILISVSIVAVLFFTGCSFPFGKSHAPALTEVASVADTPAGDDSAEGETDSLDLVMPTCDELIAPATVQSFNSSLEPFHVSDRSNINELLGPKTLAALDSGEGTIFCNWGIRSTDAVAYVAVTQLEETTKRNLVTALSDSAYIDATDSYAAEELPTEAVFRRGQSNEHRYLAEIGFDGPVLIAAVGTLSGDFASAAHKTMKRLNPGL